jgi:hypothetical protein
MDARPSMLMSARIVTPYFIPSLRWCGRSAAYLVAAGPSRQRCDRLLLPTRAAVGGNIQPITNGRPSFFAPPPSQLRRTPSFMAVAWEWAKNVFPDAGSRNILRGRASSSPYFHLKPEKI